MAKVILLGDMHIGCRSDSLAFAEHHISFFKTQLFPYMQKNKITKIIQFGDVFDRRKFINFSILDLWKSNVFDYMLENDIEMDIIIGNHDTAFKNSSEVNSPVLLLNKYPNITPYVLASDVDVYGTSVLYVPWINSFNEKHSFVRIAESKSIIAMGHFEFSGFEIERGMKMIDGISTEEFKKFDTVYSGHYHHKSNNGHIFYLGTPYQITWGDYESDKGFHVWNTEKLTLKYVKNENSMFIKIYYDDSLDENVWQSIDCSKVAGKYIKVIVVSKKNLYGFDQLMSKIYAQSPIEVKTIENIDTSLSDEVEELNLQDTGALLKGYIDSLDTSLNKEKLNSFMTSLYLEAQHMENV